MHSHAFWQRYMDRLKIMAWYIVSIPRIPEHRLNWKPQQNQNWQVVYCNFSYISGFNSGHRHRTQMINSKGTQCSSRPQTILRPTKTHISGHQTVLSYTKPSNRTKAVPSLLVFGEITSLPVTHKPLPPQRERMDAMAFTRAEMATIKAEVRISQALSSKLPSLRN